MKRGWRLWAWQTFPPCRAVELSDGAVGTQTGGPSVQATSLSTRLSCKSFVCTGVLLVLTESW